MTSLTTFHRRSIASRRRFTGSSPLLRSIQGPIPRPHTARSEKVGGENSLAHHDSAITQDGSPGDGAAPCWKKISVKAGASNSLGIACRRRVSARYIRLPGALDLPTQRLSHLKIGSPAQAT